MTLTLADVEADYRRVFAEYAQEMEREYGECWRYQAPRDLRALFLAGANLIASQFDSAEEVTP